MKKTILFLCLCYLVGVTYAQEPFRVMFYNVENLFDCQHDTLKNDYEFLPDAPKGWTQARYHDKLAKIAKVIIAKSKAEAKISKNVLREGADYYILTEMDDQVFPSGVSKKITPKLYKLKDTEIYIFFSFPPFLFDADNGMIEIKDNKGTFFKKPTQ